MSLGTFEKDPDARVPLDIDWSDYLEGDTIASSSWIVPAGLVLESSSADTSSTLAVLSGGKDGMDYTVTNRITTALGYADDRSVIVQVREQ